MLASVSFFNKYFIEPIKFDTGYNVYNTLAYGIIALITIYLVYLLLKKLKIKIDFNFFKGVAPFIVIGAYLRALVDHSYLTSSFFTVSPGLYISMLIIFLSCLSASIFISKYSKKEYWSILNNTGLLVLGVLIWQTIRKISFNSEPLLLFLIIGGFACAVTFSLVKSSKKKWATSDLSLLAILAQVFDASATFIAVDFFNAIEKHPLPHWLFEITGTGASLYLKLLIVIPIIWLISKEIKDKNLRNIILISIIILGFAQGLRNIMSLII